MMREIVIAIILAVSYCKAWEVDADEKIVTLNTSTNILIDCHTGSSTDAPSSNPLDLYRIRLLKYDSTSNQWENIAEMSTDYDDVKNYIPDVMSTARINKTDSSYIKVRFSVASTNAVGMLVCEVDVVDETGRMKVVRTNPVVVTDVKTLKCPSIQTDIIDKKKAGDDKKSEISKKLDTMQQLIETKQKELVDLMHKLNPEDSCGRQKCEKYVTPKCPDQSWIVVNYKCVKFFYNDLQTWDNAWTICENMGAHLIQLRSDEEVKAIKNFMNGEVWWVGVHFTGNKWTFMDHTTLAQSYNPWDLGEPNNPTGDEWCVQLYPIGKWHDEKCQLKRRYICERKPLNFK